MADTVLACVLLICSVAGLTGNLTVQLYFFKQTHKDISTIIYMLMSGCNTIYCLMVPFVAVSYLSGRDPALFSSKVVCVTWACLFHILQRIIIFLIATLSIVRTIHLIYPLMEINEKLVLTAIGVYLSFISFEDLFVTGL